MVIYLASFSEKIKNIPVKSSELLLPHLPERCRPVPVLVTAGEGEAKFPPIKHKSGPEDS